MHLFGHRGAIHEAPDSTLAGFRHARALAAGVTGTDFDYHLVGQEHIDWARDHGLWVIGWPGNAAADLHALQRYGVDAIGSDRPSLILPLLASPAV